MQKIQNILAKLLDILLYYPFTDSIKEPNCMISFLLNKWKVRWIWIYFLHKKCFYNLINIHFSLRICKCWMRVEMNKNGDHNAGCKSWTYFPQQQKKNGYIIALRTETEDIINCFTWCKKVFIHRNLKNTQFRKHSCYLRHYKVLVQSDLWFNYVCYCKIIFHLFLS